MLLAACGSSAPVTGANCAPGQPPLELTGLFTASDAKTYHVLPFEVGDGTGRVEVSYQWRDGGTSAPSSPFTSSTLDLGLWDEKGYRNQAGFRGWGGSRQGRIDQNKPPLFVQADSADRGFTPGPINPGTWYVELGVGAVNPDADNVSYFVKVECKAAVGSTPASDPVDPAHVANPAPGWYHADFHMHAYHSNPNAPSWEEFVAMARAAKLDFLMVTEYVTGRHWDTLGAVQRANPDLVIWPGREIITYYGHVMTHGETFGFYEYRHGFEDVAMRDIQAEIKARGQLFQVNHPTHFPPPTFTNFCRGCYFEQDRLNVDWGQVDTIEILNGPVLVTGRDIGQDSLPGQIEHPFMQTALDLWDDLLTQGYKITGVSGSDSKGVEPNEAERLRAGYGSSATAVYSDNLSRPALTAAIQAGHAYVRTRGVDRSPALEFTATAGAQAGMFGDTLTVGPTEAVTLHTVVTGGAGQTLTYLRNGQTFSEVPIPTDPFATDLVVTRAVESEGPLGTFWRIETRDSQSRTTLGNPVFLKGP